MKRGSDDMETDELPKSTPLQAALKKAIIELRNKVPDISVIDGEDVENIPVPNTSKPDQVSALPLLPMGPPLSSYWSTKLNIQPKPTPIDPPPQQHPTSLIYQHSIMPRTLIKCPTLQSGTNLAYS